MTNRIVKLGPSEVNEMWTTSHEEKLHMPADDVSEALLSAAIRLFIEETSKLRFDHAEKWARRAFNLAQSQAIEN